MALAGLWEGWRGPGGEVVRTFTIITTDANEKLRALHDRMPVILSVVGAGGVAGAAARRARGGGRRRLGRARSDRLGRGRVGRPAAVTRLLLRATGSGRR
jgi:hypothetical protein